VCGCEGVEEVVFLGGRERQREIETDVPGGGSEIEG